MTIHAVIAAAAALAFVLFNAALARGDASVPNAWRVPAAASLLFLSFSLLTIASEGPAGFWADHTRSFWGNQIWLDLLLAASVAWAFAVPQMKALGMRPLPWLALVAGTGSIGLLALAARLLYLRERAQST